MIRHNLCKQKFQSMCNSHMDVYFEKASYTLKSKILIDSRTRSKALKQEP